MADVEHGDSLRRMVLERINVLASEKRGREMIDQMISGEALADLPTISQSQTDDLKIKTADLRVWISRMTVADGMDADNIVTVEHYVDGKWVEVTV